jgi:hypothetical protein
VEAWPLAPAQIESGAVMLQSGSAATAISFVQLLEQPPAVTLTLSVVVPAASAVNVID